MTDSWCDKAERTPDLIVVEPADMLCQIPSYTISLAPHPWQVEIGEQCHLYYFLDCTRYQREPPAEKQ